MSRIFSTLVHRFFWKTEDVRFVPFLPFFVLLNLIIGLFFSFGGLIPGIAELKLFIILTAFFPNPIGAAVWGIGLVLAFVGHCLEMYFRGKGFGPWTAMAGFILWSYALGVYLSDFAIMGIFGIAAPQLFFWAWYYIEAKKYARELKQGLVTKIK